MTIQITRLSDPAVRAFVTAVNSHDREIFSSRGHMEVENESDGGHRLIARYSNDTYGEMRTTWSFTVDDEGRITRFETGQA
ncbi:nuclear transport factor 2 family protein [Streptomyces althioticus]|uniref:nuclear transport factor 2 family protein n=1 Tax=Streptomyces althioticus TaxID=83380 RepID=UPI003EBBCF5B